MSTDANQLPGQYEIEFRQAVIVAAAQMMGMSSGLNLTRALQMADTFLKTGNLEQPRG